MALFSKFVQPGRLAIGRFGDLTDKAVVVVDIVTLTRVIVVVPGEGRVVVPIRRLLMTDFKVDIRRGASISEVEEALKSNDVIGQWKQTPEGKELNSYNAKRSLNDFERFKVVRAQKIISKA